MHAPKQFLDLLDSVALTADDYRQLSTESRLAQGLPPQVENPVALRLIRRAFLAEPVTPAS